MISGCSVSFIVWVNRSDHVYRTKRDVMKTMMVPVKTKNNFKKKKDQKICIDVGDIMICDEIL